MNFLQKLTFTQLQYVLALSETRNFAQAAKKCHISQPTLSMQIQKLEDDLGVLLFDRSKKPVALTLVGERVVEQIQKIFYEAFHIRELIYEEKNELKGEYRLGVIPTLSPYLLPLFLKKFSEKCPDVYLIVEELQTHMILERLKKDQLDAGLLVTPLHMPGIKENPVFWEPFLIYHPEGIYFKEKAKVHQKDLKRENLWLLSDGHCFREQVLEICSKIKTKSKVDGNIAFEGGSLESIIALVDQKMGYTLVPFLATLHMSAEKIKKQIKQFQDPVPTREVSLVYSRSQLKRRIFDFLCESIVTSLPDSVLRIKKSDCHTRVKIHSYEA